MPQATPAQPAAQVAPPPSAAQTAAPIVPAPSPPTPLATAEVETKLAQIFQGAVQTVAPQSSNALVGDFNGDDSPDIAVVVKPAADKLAEINSEVANWTLEDPQQVVLPDPTKAVQTLPAPAAPVKAQANDVLLVIIHGYQAAGWRDAEAQQTYLLVHGVGRNLRVPARATALQTLKAHNSPLRADILQTELDHKAGYLYWTGAKYAWRALP